MRLAEALQERADLNRKLEQLRERMMNNALVQEGEEPSEDPSALLKEYRAACDRLSYLMAAINLTNAAVKAEGMTLTEIIAKKDVLVKEIAAYRDLVNRASARADRYARSEIRILSAVDVAGLQKKADSLSKELRALDAALQACNWSTELIEH